MKRLIIILAIFLFLFSAITISQASLLGNQVELKNYESSVGVGYFQQKIKMEANKSAWSNLSFEQTQIYLQFYEIITEGVDFYIRAGAADLKDEENDFTDDYKPFVAIGLDADWHFKNFTLTLLCQASMFSKYTNDKNFKISAVPTKGILQVKNYWEAHIAAIAQTNLGGLSIYGGPLFVPFKAQSTGILKNENGSERERTDYESKQNIGAVFGVRIPLFKGWNINVEGQYTEELAGGIALNKIF